MSKPIKLVYHLWVPEEIKDSYRKMMGFHLSCLKRYAKIFSESIFIIALDDVDNQERITNVENLIVNLGFTNVTFKIVKNDPLQREADTFKNEVVDNTDYDGLLFFAHNKGVVNVDSGNYENFKGSDEAIYKWVALMYYMNLERFDDIIHNMYGYPYICAGTFLIINSNLTINKYKWIFAGTFQWINTGRLHDYIKLFNIEVPTGTNRLSAERFLGEIIPFDFNAFYLYTWKWKYFTDRIDPYNQMDGVIEYLLVDGENREELIKFNNYLEENLNNSCIDIVF